jgi:diguanylate cyclase (GGDEF)-like protein
VLNDITAHRTVEEALRAEAIRDQLTGLYNRRYMEESLRREIHSAARRGSPLTVVMLDIDNFKHFNDDYGHAAGDLMLRSIGAYLQQHIRAGDIACRYGGEELTLIFPDTSIEDTRRRVDGLRQQLGALRVSYRDSELAGVAISAGIAGMPAHGDSPEALLRVADAALYRAKTLGRDRVVIGDL